MDGRDCQSAPNSSSYFMQHRGLGNSGFHNVFYGSHGMRSLPVSSQSLPVTQPPPPLHVSSGAVFRGESPPPSPSPSTSPPPPAPVSSHGNAVGGQVRADLGGPVTKKRGRPRKYGPDGMLAVPVSPGSSPPGMGAVVLNSGPESMESGQKRRGRPPGSGKKQQLASYGEWITSSAGGAFTPHLLMISSGEDIDAKILAFSQQAPRVFCVLSATGAVSAVTIRQPSGGTITYEGLFEILFLSGSYVHSDHGGSQNQNGGLSVSLAGQDGRVIGGGVGGRLIASSPVQIILGSFIFASSKLKKTPKMGPELDSENEFQTEQLETLSAPATGNITPILSRWTGSRQIDMRNSHMDIDLTRG